MLVCALALLLPLARPAAADVVVVVAGNSPLKSVTSRQLAALFLGKINALPDGTRLTPVDLAEEAPARQAFYSTIIGKSANQVRAYWSRLIFSGRGQPPRTFESEDALKKMLSQHPDWIGYIDSGAVDSSVRVLTLSD